jgi:hypothetical protein
MDIIAAHHPRLTVHASQLQLLVQAIHILPWLISVYLAFSVAHHSYPARFSMQYFV